MQIDLTKAEFSMAVKVYLESLGFSREDFDVEARLIAGRNGNDGRVEVQLMPKSEPSMERVLTDVQPSESLADYKEIQDEMKDSKEEAEEETPEISEPSNEEDALEEIKTPVIEPIDDEDDEEF